MLTSLAEGGQTPVVITESGDRRGDMGGGVFVILLFLIIIAVVAIPLLRNREPIAERGGSLAELLPAMMVMQSATTRQTVDVNSHNTNQNGGGPSNFQLYQQGVETNNNVFTQSCNTREQIREEASKTRELIQSLHAQELVEENRRLQTELLTQNTNFAIERSNNAQTNQLSGVYYSLQRDIAEIKNELPRQPVPAFSVNPYGVYRPQPFRADNCRRDNCGGFCGE